MNTKHQTAVEYETSITQKCELALVALMRAFGSFKQNIRLVGGLTPRYLTPERPPDVPAHAGTTDVDIVLNVALLSQEGAYAKLKAQLKQNNFERVVNDGKASSWQWRYTAVDIPIVIEFLQGTDDEAQNGRIGSIDGEDVSAVQFLHADLAHEWFNTAEISVELPKGDGVATETIYFADAITFITLKTFAFDHRAERKDSADLIHVMKFGGPLEDLATLFAERIREGTRSAVLYQVLALLEKHYCDSHGAEGWRKEGPTKYANFHSFTVGTEQSESERRRVSGMVTYFIELVRGQLEVSTTDVSVIGSLK